MSELSNAKHEHFALLVAKGEPAARAYEFVGYKAKGSPQSACRLAKSAKVRARIAELRDAINAPAHERALEKAAVDKAWVLKELIEVVKMAKRGEAVLDKDGNPTGDTKQNLGAANKALELIGKEHGMFIDRKEIRSGSILETMERQDLRDLETQLLDAITYRKALPEDTGCTVN